MKPLDRLYENIQFIKDTESWSMYHIPGRVHVIFIKIFNRYLILNEIKLVKWWHRILVQSVQCQNQKTYISL